MKKEELLQILRFIVSSGCAAATYYLAYLVLAKLFGVWYAASSFLAGILSFGANFVLQKFWTFQNRETKTVLKQVVLYYVMKGALLLAHTGALYCLVEYLHIPDVYAPAPPTLVFFYVSYVITRKIFAKKPGT